MYKIIPQAVPVSSAFYERIKDQSTTAKTIFNSRRNDKKRKQTPLRGCACFKHIVEKTVRQALNLDDDYKFNSWNILKSLPGCQKQLYHTDYDVSSPCDKLPYGLLVSLEDKTYIYIYTDREHKIELNKGDLFVFRADLVHAGADYDHQNIRLHCYIDSVQMKRVRNTTYVVHMA